MGRPTNYTIQLAEEICDQIATNSTGIRDLCERNPHWPCADTIFTWIGKNKEFSDLYTRAKQQQISVFIDEIGKISDDETNDKLQTEKGFIGNNAAINRARLRIDTRKWLACKLAPKVYGERITTEIKTDLSAMSADEIAQAIKALSIKQKRAIISAILEQMQNELRSTA